MSAGIEWDPDQALPLDGLRIVDLTWLVPGPLTTRQLVDWGAEVLKIEDPGRGGDGTRHMLLSLEDRLHDRPSGLFQHLNQGKTLIALDLATDDGREALLDLVRGADALIENFRPGVMNRLGLGWEVLRAANPRLVMCAISGYGQRGAYAQRAGHDINYVALSGVLWQNAEFHGDPVLPNIQIAELMGGSQTALAGLLAGLLGAQRHGRGRFIDISMTHGVWRNNVLARFEARSRGAPTRAGAGLLSGGSPCYGVYRTADGRCLAVGALEHKFWRRLCDALQRPEWSDLHWSLGQQPASDDALALKSALADVIAQQPLAHWMALFDTVDCCVTPVLRPDEVTRHAWFGAGASGG